MEPAYEPGEDEDDAPLDQSRVCVVCEGWFNGHGNQRTCGEECQRERARRKKREWSQRTQRKYPRDYKREMLLRRWRNAA